MNDSTKTNSRGKIIIIIDATYWVPLNIIVDTLISFLWSEWFYPYFTDETGWENK